MDLNLEPESSHTRLILLDGRLALLGRVIGLSKQHAVVPGSLFGYANAAGLAFKVRYVHSPAPFFLDMEKTTYLGLLRLGLLGLGLRRRSPFLSSGACIKKVWSASALISHPVILHLLLDPKSHDILCFNILK